MAWDMVYCGLENEASTEIVELGRISRVTEVMEPSRSPDRNAAPGEKRPSDDASVARWPNAE
jgi:hypothetical protein